MQSGFLKMSSHMCSARNETACLERMCEAVRKEAMRCSRRFLGVANGCRYCVLHVYVLTCFVPQRCMEKLGPG